MNIYEFYRQIASIDPKVLDACSKLERLYKQIPETKGCLDNINKKDGCGGWCCLVQTPQLLYCEFLNIWNHIKDNCSNDEICDVIEKSMLNVIKGDTTKGCVFFNEETKLCKIHNKRPYNCFLPDTWVYTDKGPKKIKDILSGDRVFGHDGKLYNVIATKSIWHSGKIYNIKHQGNDIDSWCTGDHKWHVDYRKNKEKKIKLVWKNAQELVGKKCKKYGDYLSLPINYEKRKKLNYVNLLNFISAKKENNRLFSFTGSNDIMKSLPMKIKINDDFLFMLGLYLAEGSSTAHSVCFSMHIREREHLLKIEKYLKSLGLYCSWPKVYHSKNLSVLRIGSSIFAHFMTAIAGKLAYGKKINENLFSKLSYIQLKKIYDAWDIGDGVKTLKRNEYSTTTISESLALQMNLILLFNGIFARIYKKKQKNRGYCSYDVHVFPSVIEKKVKKGQGTKIIETQEYIIPPLAKVEVKEYEGPVVDIQVSGVSNFVTSSGIAHNCYIYGITPDEEFKSRYEKVKELYKDVLTAVIKEQCDLVSICDDSNVTIFQTNRWWKELVKIEKSIGINEENINDKEGGSYRTPHDHILLFLMPENVLSSLAGIRLYDKAEDRILAIKELMSHIRSFYNKK